MRDTVNVHRARFALGLTLATVVGVSLTAADLKNVLTDYTVTAWTARDGLPPGNVWALAQDGAGYLWVGSDRGLFRFDGVRFIHWEAEAPRFGTTPVRSLLAGRDGTLWVGFGDAGGVSRIQDGVIRGFGEGDGLPGGAIMVLLEDAAGTLWAGGDAGLFSLSGDRWVKWQARTTAFPMSLSMPRTRIAEGVLRRHRERGLRAPGVGTRLQADRRLGRRGRARRRRRHAGFPAIVHRDGVGPGAGDRGPLSPIVRRGLVGTGIVNDWNTGFRAVGRMAVPFTGQDSGRGTGCCSMGEKISGWARSARGCGAYVHVRRRRGS